MYSAVSRTQTDVASYKRVGVTFAAFPEDDNAFNLIMDIVGLTFPVGGAPVWDKSMYDRDVTVHMHPTTTQSPC
jgi:hypothetical protein